MKPSSLAVVAFALGVSLNASAEEATEKESGPGVPAMVLLGVGSSGILGGIGTFMVVANNGTFDGSQASDRTKDREIEAGAIMLGGGTFLTTLSLIDGLTNETILHPAKQKKASWGLWVTPTGEKARASGFVLGVSGSF